MRLTSTCPGDVNKMISNSKRTSFIYAKAAMSQRLRRYAPLLRTLHRASPTRKKELLKNNSDREFMNCLCECAKNVIYGRVPLNARQRVELAKRKRILRLLALKKTPLKTKKTIVQKGGFIGALLGPIVSVLGSLFAPATVS